MNGESGSRAERITQSIVTISFKHSVLFSVKAARFQKWSIPGHPLLDYLQRLLPGILLCTAITFAAMLLEAAETYLVGHTYLEALVLAILIGIAIRAAWPPGPRFDPGIYVCAKFVLECAIVMLGASVSAAAIVALRPILIVGIVCIVAVAIGTSYCICRLLGLPQRMAILIACGNSICGNSAIAAVAPVIGADGNDIASSISFTAVLGVVVVLNCRCSPRCCIYR